MKGARLDYVQMDVECIDKPRFQAFLDMIDPIAGLFIIQIWLKLGRAQDARIPRKYAASLCHSVRCPKDIAEKAIEIAISEELLELDGDYITLGRIQEDQGNVATKRVKWRAAKGGIHSDSGEIPEGKTSECIETLNTEPEPEYEPESKKEGGSGEGADPPGTDPNEIKDLPAEFNHPELIEAWFRYRKVRQKRWKRDYERIQFDADAVNYHGRVRDFIRDLNAAASGAWANIRDTRSSDPEKSKPKRPRSPEFKLPERAKLEALSETLTDSQRAALSKLKGAA